MDQQKRSLVAQLRQQWWRYRGERPLLVTFWPQDFRRHSTHPLDGQHYQITRYVRASDPRFFEVWGRFVEEARLFSDARKFIRLKV